MHVSKIGQNYIRFEVMEFSHGNFGPNQVPCRTKFNRVMDGMAILVQNIGGHLSGFSLCDECFSNLTKTPFSGSQKPKCGL